MAIMNALIAVSNIGLLKRKKYKMNKVYESPTTVVHDDRDALTIDQAFELLWNGFYIRVNDPPDFSAENESDIYGREFLIGITDILSRDVLESQQKEKIVRAIHDFLRSYEIYRVGLTV